MPHDDELSDETVEALLSGSVPDGGLAALAAFVADVRGAAGPAPAPSEALVAFLAGGVSTDKGDLPATAASNVHGPAEQVSGLPKWRKLTMHIKGYVAGLGIAAKVAMGAGIAAAATSGAGAAGVLPSPVQHAVAAAVDAVTPFSLPDPVPPAPAEARKHTTDRPAAPDPAAPPTPVGHDGPAAPPAASPDGPATPFPAAPGSGEPPAPAAPPGVGPGLGGIPPAPTTTTTAPAPRSHEPATTTTTTAAPRPTEPAPSTTTTTAPAPAEKTESTNPESISVSCTPAGDPARVSCTWTASTSPEHATYVLLRTTTGAPGRVVAQSPDTLAFTDTTPVPGVTYGYRVVSLRADGTVESHSNLVTIGCCRS